MMASKRASSSPKLVSMRQASSGHFGADVAADGDAVAVGEADVEDGNVGFKGGDAGEGGGGGAGFADDGDAGFGFEEVADAHPDDLMIVQQTPRIVVPLPALIHR